MSNSSKGLFGIGLFLIMAMFAGCDKKNEPGLTPEEFLAAKLGIVDAVQLAKDFEIIDDSLERWNIVPEIEPLGVRYTVQVVGQGPKPNLSSTLTVKYTGKLLKTGTTFAQTGNVTSKLYDFIIGWQTTLPLITEGSKITLYVPSQYGYGKIDYSEGGTVKIPKDSNLIFEIEILDVE